MSSSTGSPQSESKQGEPFEDHVENTIEAELLETTFDPVFGADPHKIVGVPKSEVKRTGRFLPSRLVGGPFDISESSWFRYTFFFLIYFGFSLPLAFLGWYYKVIGFEEGLSKFLVVNVFTFTQIPFFLRPVWSIPVDRYTSSPYGRRRPWVVGGILLHLLLILPLWFISVTGSPYLWAFILLLAMVPRVVAEQAIGGIMVDYVPDLGKVGGTIVAAFRLGGIFVSLAFVWWLFGSNSPFYDDVLGKVDTSAAYSAVMPFLLLFLAIGAVVAYLMVEGKWARGEKTSEKRTWDSSQTFSQKIKGAFSTRTALLCLVAAVLLPLGDGFEAWEMFYLMERKGWTSQTLADWRLFFVAVAFASILGPWLADKWGPLRSIRWFAVVASGAYATSAMLIFIDAPVLAFIAVWVVVLVSTDWMIFTFETVILPRIVDVRMGATHLGIYTSVRAISATFLMIWLGGFVLFNSDYWLLYGLAALGPLLGFALFKGMKIPEASQLSEGIEDAFDLDTATHWLRTKLSILPMFSSMSQLDAPKRMRFVMLVVGTISLVILGATSFLWTASVEVKEPLFEAEWRQTSRGDETQFAAMQVGETRPFELEGDGGGGLLRGSFSVSLESEDDGLPLVDTCSSQWTVEFASPAPLTNDVDTNASNQLWSGNPVSGYYFSALTPGILPSFASSEEGVVEEEIDEYYENESFMYGTQGVWKLNLTYEDDGSANTDCVATFTVNITLDQMVLPTHSEIADLTETIDEERHFGLAVASVFGLPLLLATPIISWLVGRKVEEKSNIIE